MRRYAALIALTLLLAAFAAATAQGAPFSIDIDATEPARGAMLDYTVTVRTTKELWIKVNVAIYVPGKGWSGWTKIWEGKVYSIARVSKSYYIPHDAGNGSVVMWVEVEYYSPRDYAVIDGMKYYNDYSVIYVVGALPCDAAQLWYTRYRELKDSCDRLNESYREALRDAEELRGRYADLQSRYEALKDNQSRLLQEKTRLEAEAAVLRERLAAEENLNRALEVGVLLAVAAAVGLAAAYVTARRHCQ